MRGFLAIFQRELLIRRLILAAAAAASLVPFVGPLARGLSGAAAADERASIAVVVAAAFAIGLAIGLGASMAAPAIANRRIAFDFARPVSGTAIWLGRAAAAAILVLGSAAITLLPALVAGARFDPRDFVTDAVLGRRWPLLAALAVIAAFGAAHTLSVMVRSRSVLIALDAVLGGVLALAAASCLARLPFFLAPVPRLLVAGGLGIAGFVALLAACSISVTRGRSDIRAAHRSLSKTLWIVAGAAVAAAAAYTAWVLGAGPEDVHLSEAFAAPRGPWVNLQGKARGADASLLFDTATARFQRYSASVMSDDASFSSDGAHAAWVQSSGEKPPFEVVTLALDRPTVPLHTQLLFPFPPRLVLSEDGSRVASLGAETITLYELRTGRTLAAAGVRGGTAVDQRGFFVDPSRFRIYVQLAGSGAERRLEISELDASTRTLKRLGSHELPKGGAALIADRAGDRVIAIAFAARQAMLLDGTTGAEIARLATEGVPGTTRWARFLGDGRIVLSESSPAGASLHVFDARGSSLSIQRLDARWVRLGGEIAPGRLAIVTGRGESREHGSTWIVDLDGGPMQKLGSDLNPIAVGYPAALNQLPETGSEGTRLFVHGDDELVRVDPVTGASRVVLRSKPAAPHPKPVSAMPRTR